MEYEEEEEVARRAAGERNSGSRTLRVLVGFALLMAVVSHPGDSRCSIKIAAAAVEGVHWEA